MKRIPALSTCLAILSLAFQAVTVQAADVYRWLDSRGIVHYSDMPSPDAEKINPGKFLDQAAPDEDLPYATRVSRQNFPVTLYVGSGCGAACDQARGLLNKRGIPYAEKSLSTKDQIDAFKKLTGSDIVPTLAVGKSYLKGFQSEQWHGELDIAGYPKIAPYRAPAVPAEPAAEKEKASETATENPDFRESPATP